MRASAAVVRVPEVAFGAVVLLAVAREFWPIAVAFEPDASEPSPIAVPLVPDAVERWPKADVLLPLATALSPNAEANTPVAAAPKHCTWPAPPAQSCAKTAGAAMAISTAAVRDARTGVLRA